MERPQDNYVIQNRNSKNIFGHYEDSAKGSLLLSFEIHDESISESISKLIKMSVFHTFFDEFYRPEAERPLRKLLFDAAKATLIKTKKLYRDNNLETDLSINIFLIKDYICYYYQFGVIPIGVYREGSVIQLKNKWSNINFTKDKIFFNTINTMPEPEYFKFHAEDILLTFSNRFLDVTTDEIIPNLKNPEYEFTRFNDSIPGAAEDNEIEHYFYHMILFGQEPAQEAAVQAADGAAQKGGKSGLLILFIVLFLISLMLNVYQYYKLGPKEVVPKVIPAAADTLSDESSEEISAQSFDEEENIFDLKKNWIYLTKDKITSSPLVEENVVYFASRDRNFYAVNSETGALIWKKAFPGGIGSSPALFNNRLYFGCYDRKLYCIDKKDGQTLWSYKTDAMLKASPKVYKNSVYVGSESGKMYAIDNITGQKKWHFSSKKNIRGAAAFYEDYVIFNSLDNHCYCVNAADGTQNWRYRTNGEIFPSPVISDGNVVFGSKDKHIYNIEIETGFLRWKFKCKDIIYSTVGLYKDYIIASDHKGNIYALEEETGVLVWETNINKSNSKVLSSVSVYKDYVFIGNYNNFLYTLSAEDGQMLHKFNALSEIYSTPAASNNKLYFGTFARKFYCLNILD